MLRLLNSNTVPVGGFRFKDPDTQYEYDRPYANFQELEEHVNQHRSQNKLEPITDFRVVWEHWTCNQFGMERKCCPVSVQIKRSFEQYVAGAKTYIRKIIKKSPFVSSEISESRAAVCVDCDQNLKNTGHNMSQFYTDRFMKHQVGSLKTSEDHKLFTCKICTCLIRSKVHYPSEEVAKSLSDTEVGRLTREPRSLTTGKRLKCWQITAIEEAHR